MRLCSRKLQPKIQSVRLSMTAKLPHSLSLRQSLLHTRGNRKCTPSSCPRMQHCQQCPATTLQLRCLQHRKLRRNGLSRASNRHEFVVQRRTTLARAQSGGAAALDPSIVGTRARPPQPQKDPEALPQGGGGNNNRGWKSPPGGGGGGDNNSWWDAYSDWWEDHNPFTKLSLGFRMRVAADPSFGFKLLVECGLDAAIILVVNVLARRDRFMSELEFVLSQMAVSLLNDFALVFLLAPVPQCSVLQRGSFRAKLAALPAHVFQQAPTGLERGYSLTQRAACFAAKAVQYGCVGLIMGTAGSSLVLALSTFRTALDESYQPPATYQPVLGTGLGWLLFMAGSSNIRYNLINFVEDFAYNRFPGPKSKALSISLRFSNNIFGAHSWMHMATLLNLNRPRKTTAQAASDPTDELITEMPAAH